MSRGGEENNIYPLVTHFTSLHFTLGMRDSFEEIRLSKTRDASFPQGD